MNFNKSFVENYHFIQKNNEFMDVNSILNQTHLVGIFPIQKIPFLNKDRNYTQLKNYGIPAGIVKFNNYKIFGGDSTILKIKKKNNEKTNFINDVEFDALFNNIIHKVNKNKTKKIKYKI